MEFHIGDKVRVLKDIDCGFLGGFDKDDEMVITGFEGDLCCFAESELIGVPNKYLELVTEVD